MLNVRLVNNDETISLARFSIDIVIIIVVVVNVGFAVG
jgi:hypothetical protein